MNLKKFIAGSAATVGSVALFVAPVMAKVETVSGPLNLSVPASIVFTCGGGDYHHTIDGLVLEEDGHFTGTGHYDLNDDYEWTVEGDTDGANFDFHLVYTGLNPGYQLNGDGTVNEDGSVDGTTDGNCQTFAIEEGFASMFMGNHGHWVRMSEDKHEAAQSRIGMPTQSRGHTK